MVDRTISAEFAFDPMDTSRTKDWELMKQIREASPVILMQAIAIPLPGSIAAHALGLPDELHDQVMEWFRFEAPVTFLTRTAKKDGEIGGCPVDAGEHIVLGIASGNRDERVYPNAGEFLLDRDGTPEHLAFGAGPHLCLGNHLTRMVGQVVLDEMLDRFAPGRLELAEDFEWVCVDHIQEYGPETLDVVINR